MIKISKISLKLLNLENPRNFVFYCFTVYKLFTIEIEDERGSHESQPSIYIFNWVIVYFFINVGKSKLEKLRGYKVLHAITATIDKKVSYILV